VRALGRMRCTRYGVSEPTGAPRSTVRCVARQPTLGAPGGTPRPSRKPGGDAQTANSRRSRRAAAPRMTDERRAIWPRIIRRASTDFDEFARWVEGTEILRRMKGPCRAELISADLGAVSITRWSHTAPFIANSVVGANQRVFFVQSYGGAPVLVNGHTLDERRILDHRPGAEIRIASKPGPAVQIIELVVDPGELDRLCCPGPERGFGAVPRPSTVLEPEPGTLAALRDVCASALADPEDRLTPGGANSSAALTEAVMRALVTAANSGVQRGKGRELARDLHARIVQRADEFIRAKPSEYVPLSALCEATAVKPRQLQRAFNEVYACGPTRYQKLRRLHLARAFLRDPTRATRVTDVAISLGFYDLGRFARAYAALFGESPSITLARIRQTLPEHERVVEPPQRGERPERMSQST
jgi:AraC-like DNA-binding protein